MPALHRAENMGRVLLMPVAGFDGHSQAEITGLLGACAGTVSPIRKRSHEVLRDGIDAP